MIFIVADKEATALGAIGSLRLRLAEDLGWIDEDKVSILWICDFPLFKYNEEEKRWESEHHPFTSPGVEDAGSIESAMGTVKARAYDLVINGMELASGSIRIHDIKMQRKIFSLIGIDEREADERFGFLLRAFRYGAPPHGGIAFGLDRLTTLFTKDRSIRDVIAFPKTQRGSCPLSGAPTPVEDRQLKDLNIRLRS
jgi:aspartyl-tRNA synthetase